MSADLIDETRFSPELSRHVFDVIARVASLPEIRTEVEANHDQNRWWPTTILDPRLRMLAAGWSTRVSYTMVDTYASVIRNAEDLGFDKLAEISDTEISNVIRPIGLPTARISYLRSLTKFIDVLAEEDIDVRSHNTENLISYFAREVDQASYKVAQCAVLYARGYHCGIIPVDSGMVTKLAPALGILLPSGPIAHERMRVLLEACVADRASDYRNLARRQDVNLPEDSAPTWWAHLTLIYFKRRFLNRPGPRLCSRRPVCPTVVDCSHANPQKGN